MPKIHLTFEVLQGQALTEAIPFLGPHELLRLRTRACQGFGARYDGRLIGLTLFQHQPSRLVMEYICVDPRYRLMGVGRELLRTLCALARSKHLDLLFSFEAGGMRNGFYRFVSSTGLFTIRRQEGCVAVAPPEAVTQVARRYPKAGEPAPLFFRQSPLLRREFLSHLEDQYPDIVWELRNLPSVYREELCRCILQNGQIQAVCLFRETGAELELKLLYARPGKGPLAAKSLLSALRELDAQGPRSLRFAPVGEAAQKLLDSLCPSHCVEGWIYTAYAMGDILSGGEVGGRIPAGKR